MSIRHELRFFHARRALAALWAAEAATHPVRRVMHKALARLHLSLAELVSPAAATPR